MATPSFERDIQPIFQQFVGPMRWRLDLTNYDDVKVNATLIYSRINVAPDDPSRMPPAPFDPLTVDQVRAFKNWMDAGCPP